MTVHRLRLAAEIVVAYASARRGLRHSDLRITVQRLRAAPAAAPLMADADAVALGRRLARAVVRTLAVTPADSRCLMRSLVLTRLLARRGVSSQLVIAVRPGEQFAAHAWIEHHGVPLLPSGAPAFEQLVTL